MCRVRKPLILALFIITTFLWVSVTPAVALAQTVSMSIETRLADDFSTSSLVYADVMLNGFNDYLGGVDFELTYDPNVLEHVVINDRDVVVNKSILSSQYYAPIVSAGSVRIGVAADDKNVADQAIPAQGVLVGAEKVKLGTAVFRVIAHKNSAIQLVKYDLLRVVQSTDPSPALASVDVTVTGADVVLPAPLVVSTAPLDAATSVPLSNEISATFDYDVNSLDTSKITVTENAVAVTGYTPSVSGKKLTITGLTLKNGTSYTVSLASGVVADAVTGVASGAKSWSFTTEVAQGGTVTGFVYLDGLTAGKSINVEIVLKDFAGIIKASTQTASDGSFSFNEIPVSATQYTLWYSASKSLVDKGVPFFILKNGDMIDVPEIVLKVGDANGDNKVNSKDLGLLIQTFNKNNQVTGYNANCDYNSDDKVNSKDLSLLIKSFNKQGIDYNNDGKIDASDVFWNLTN